MGSGERRAVTVLATLVMLLGACTTTSSSPATTTTAFAAETATPGDPTGTGLTLAGPTATPDIPEALSLVKEQSLIYTRVVRVDWGDRDETQTQTVTADLEAGTIHHALDDDGELIRTADAVYRRTDSTECGPWLALGEEQIEMELGTDNLLAIEPLEVLLQAGDLSVPTTTDQGKIVYETSVPSGLAIRGIVVGRSRLNSMQSPLTVTVGKDGSTVELVIDASEAFRAMARGMQPDVVASTTWTVQRGTSGAPITIPTDVIEDPECQASGPRRSPVDPAVTTTAGP